MMKELQDENEGNQDGKGVMQFGEEKLPNSE
jgi:hypothetical protein